MVNPFSWIRSRVRAAVIEGFADGLEVISQGAEVVDNTLPAALVERLKLPAMSTPALPSEPDVEPDSKPRSRKATVAA